MGAWVNRSTGEQETAAMTNIVRTQNLSIHPLSYSPLCAMPFFVITNDKICHILRSKPLPNRAPHAAISFQTFINGRSGRHGKISKESIQIRHQSCSTPYHGAEKKRLMRREKGDDNSGVNAVDSQLLNKARNKQ